MPGRRIVILSLLTCLFTSTSVARAADAEETKMEAAPEAAPPKPRTLAAVAPAAATASLPFRLGLYYAHAFGQSGDLTRMVVGPRPNGPKLPSPAVFGIDLGIGLGSHVRYHFAAGLEWESQTGYAAKGFRFDPIGLGFPIEIWRNDDVTIHVEPMLHLVRGEILFQSQPESDDSSLFRIESGIGGAISAVTHHWFFALEPISVDFRVFEANSQWVHTGFSQLWWFQLTAGREF